MMVCQKSAVPSWGGTTRPRAGNTVAPPALTVDRYTMKVSSLSPWSRHVSDVGWCCAM